MKLLTTEDVLYERVTFRDPDSFLRITLIRNRKYRILGIRVWTRTIATEPFPEWAWIQQATTGFTSWEKSI